MQITENTGQTCVLKAPVAAGVPVGLRIPDIFIVADFSITDASLAPYDDRIRSEVSVRMVEQISRDPYGHDPYDKIDVVIQNGRVQAWGVRVGR